MNMVVIKMLLIVKKLSATEKNMLNKILTGANNKFLTCFVKFVSCQ